jgi:hypothetical protein
MAQQPSTLPASLAILLAAALVGGAMFSWTLYVAPIVMPKPGILDQRGGQAALSLGDAAAEAQTADRSTYQEALDRPLFAKDRRPPSAVVPTAPTVATVPDAPEVALSMDGIRIQGVAIGNGKARAFIVSPDSPKGAWLVRGDKVAGWRIAEVNEGFMRLEGQGRQEKLFLYDPAARRKTLADTGQQAPALVEPRIVPEPKP